MALDSVRLILICILGVTLLGAWGLWKRSRASTAESGLPRGQVVYADTEEWERSEPLFSQDCGLAGRPDYVVRHGRFYIPIELKPGRRPRPGPDPQPYAADVMQLAAYCVLVERAYGRRPPYGILCYRDVNFRIPFGASLRRTLLRQLDAMRRDFGRWEVRRSHDDPQRCRFCGHRSHCGQDLV
jgi:CRISPR-associated exonuclease Cas4